MACITPFTKRNEDSQEWQVFPCGKCPDCLKRRTSGWSFRLMKQDDVADNSLFVTLTYNTDHVPITGKGFMCLSKADVQKFFKRLRKISPDKNIKYFAVGEYGTDSYRPHYHAIIYNSCIGDIEAAWRIDGKPIGTVHYGSVNGASIGYTLKYMMKESRIPLHKNDDRIKEFALMSKD